MSIEIKVPVLPESIADATVAKWHKKAGDTVKRDETIVDIETDKVMLEVPAPEDGVLESIFADEGATVLAEQVIGKIGASHAAHAATTKQEVESSVALMNGNITERSTKVTAPEKSKDSKTAAVVAGPAVRRMLSEHDVKVAEVEGSGKSGRVLKTDVEKHLQKPTVASKSSEVEVASISDERTEKRVPMTRLRQRVAERLLSAQHDMAILTTFNEVDMKAVMGLRNQYKDQFEKAHNIRLGFMSFFVKAAVAALKKFPDVNAFIDGHDIVYHGFCDIGVAVSTERGLVVPVLRNGEHLSMAQIETKISEYAQKAKNNKLTLEEMMGGTFSITNGGVFGSLLSTPILNPPQSAILGMHKIEERPVVINGEIVIRPMMYLALSYDHRIIDGRDSVQFLRTIKELLEDPARLLLDI